MKKLIALLAMAPLCGAFLLEPALAQKTKAQLNTQVGTTFPDNTTGQITPSAVRTFQSDVINSIMPTAPVVNGNFACFNGTTGLLQDCGTSPTNISIGTSNIQDAAVTNVKVAPGAANTFKGSLDGAATSDISLTACSLAYQVTKWVAGTGWQCGINPVLPSRATAATLDLSAYTVVSTLGYATGGDGGGAVFKNVGSTAPLDQHISTFSRVGGSGYTNGTYKFVVLTGGSGVAFYANITVSGNTVSAVTPIFNAGGFGYKVGDVLTTTAANIGGTGSGFSITVTAVTTVRGSFTDSAGNNWQYVPGSAIDPRQFGVKMDWLGTDAGATDNYATLQAALNFASYSATAVASGGAGNSSGTKVLFPSGVAMVCSSGLQMWNSTQLQGQGLVNSGLHGCDTFPAAQSLIKIGDSVAQIACFGNRISDIDLSVSYSATGTAGVFALFTNCAQQGELINNVAIYPGPKGCLDLEVGYGGAATLYSKGLFCTLANSPSSEGIKINYGTTLIHFIDTLIEASSAPSATGINALGGVITLDNYHSEGIGSPLVVNMTTANHSLLLFNSTGGNGCTNFVTLSSTNTPGNFALFNSQKNGCSGNLVSNGQPAGASRAADAKPSSCTTGVAGTAGFCIFNP